MEPLGRVLLIESASRDIGQLVLDRLQPLTDRLDVLTCYSDAPSGMRDKLFSVHQPEAVANRKTFVDRLARGPYDAVAIVCAGSGVLAKWKWAIAARTKAKILLVDEYGEAFYANARNLAPLGVLAIRRSNIASLPHLLLALCKLLVTPFTILYLLSYTVQVHARVWLRRRIRS